MKNNYAIAVTNARSNYIQALSEMMRVLEVELHGIRTNKLAPSSADYFYEAGQKVMKARGDLEKAITLESMLNNE